MSAIKEERFPAIIEFVKELYPGETPVPLHAPRFIGNEKKYLSECIDTTFVSYVGAFVSRFEKMVEEYTGVSNAVAVVNGTSALHLGLLALGVGEGDEVITQPLTFVATCNAIRHVGADPVFVDVETKGLGICPEALEQFLADKTRRGTDGKLYNKVSGRCITACVPMHTFGHLSFIDEICAICDNYKIPVLEDSAEALGSFMSNGSSPRHAGSIGRAGILSFNGNKPVTTGGGGMFITNDKALADRVRHLSTTAKKAHAYLFNHDMVGYNLRLPNLNAAVGCAQMENFSTVLANKRELADIYANFFAGLDIDFVCERSGTSANYWLNVILAKDRAERDKFIEFAASNHVQVRPAWTLMPDLPMYMECISTDIPNARWLGDRIINLPSSYRVR